MSNPALLFWDSDALIQILLTNAISPLKTLKAEYGIQSAVVPEVETEILSSRRFARLAPSLKKAINTSVIEVLDNQTYMALLSKNNSLQTDAMGTSFADIQALGRRYNQRVDTGEAYTFAAALTLHQPAVSHDWSALQTLMTAGLPIPFSVLRTYDLIVFAHQIGLMAERDCDRFRKALVQDNEFVPKQQRAASFRDGLAFFEPRLIDASKSIMGIPPRRGGPARHSSPLYISPIQQAPAAI
jgi:hypothetical protein